MHYHYPVASYVMFALGWVLHAWGRASNTIQSDLNGIKGYRQYMETNGNIVIGRFFIAGCFFGALIEYDVLMPFFGGFLSSVETFYKAHPGPLPLYWPITGIMGWFIDSFIDTALGFASKKLPWLQNEIPPQLTKG